MLSREKRLTSSRDFDAVYRKGQRAHSRSFNLSYKRNRIGISRIGIVVGKKFSKKAVSRNKAKRVLREAAKSIYPLMLPGFDIVIFLKTNNTEKVVLPEITKEIKRAFERAGILK